MFRLCNIATAVYFHLQIASEKLITEHSDLPLQSGDLLCMNCLKALQKQLSQVTLEHAGPSNHLQEFAGPSKSTCYSSTQDNDSTSDNDNPGSLHCSRLMKHLPHNKSLHSESDICIVDGM